MYLKHKSTLQLVQRVVEYSKLEDEYFEANPTGGMLDFIETLGITRQCYYRLIRRYNEIAAKGYSNVPVIEHTKQWKVGHEK